MDVLTKFFYFINLPQINKVLRFKFLFISFLFSFSAQAYNQDFMLSIDIMPKLMQKRISLSDELNTHSVISSKLSYGLELNLRNRIGSKNSFYTFHFSQNTVRLTETSNATLANKELNYLDAGLIYEHYFRFIMLTFGAKFSKEYYMLIDNNIVEPTNLQNTYGLAGFYIITKAGYKSKAYTGIEYGQAFSTSKVNNQDLKKAFYFKVSTKFVFKFPNSSYLLDLFYKSSQINYLNIQQNIPEIGIGLGVRF